MHSWYWHGSIKQTDLYNKRVWISDWTAPISRIVFTLVRYSYVLIDRLLIIPCSTSNTKITESKKANGWKQNWIVREERTWYSPLSGFLFGTYEKKKDNTKHCNVFFLVCREKEDINTKRWRRKAKKKTSIELGQQPPQEKKGSWLS